MIKRLLLLMAAAGLAFAGLTSVASSASAEGCNAKTGTLVAVDFGHFGQGVSTGCSIGAPTGADLLARNGFRLDMVVRFPGAICRIQGQPAEVPEDCRQMPPGSAYWSLWVAGPGSNRWTYSAAGAGSDHPVKGGVEAWAFGAGTQPAFSPQQIRDTWRPPPSKTATPRVEPTAPAVGNAPSSSPAATQSNREAPAPSGPAAPELPTKSSAASESAPATAQPSAHDTAPQIVKGAPTAPAKKAGSGGPWGVLIALGIAGVLGVGGWVARRRFS